MKRRLLSAFMCLCMMLTMVPAALAADEGTEQTPTTPETSTEQNQPSQETPAEETPVEGLQEALNKAAEDNTNKTVTLESDVELSEQVTVPAGVTLDGDGHTISVADDVTWSSDNSSKYMLLCSGANSTVQNVILDAENNASGCLQFYKATGGKVADITLKNAKQLGLMVNASTVTATGTIELSGNGWGNVINVGWGSGITDVETCSFDASNATLVGVTSIYTDATDKTNAGNNEESGSKFTISAPSNFVQVDTDESSGYALAVAEISGTKYASLQSAVDAVADATSTEITLLEDITLTKSITIPANKTITINGNGKIISYPALNPKVAFTGAGEGVQQEGIPGGVTLTVNNTTFKNTTSGDPAGYAVLLDFNANGTKVTMDSCTFENLYCGVYVNPVTDATITAPAISITNSTYENTTYGYSVDEVTNGAVVGVVEPIFTDNTGITTEAETWKDAVAATVTSSGVTKAYSSWETAYAEANVNDTITLQKNITGPITIDKAVTIEGNGKTITAENGDAITVTAASVTLNGVNAIAEGKNALGHALVVGTQETAVSGAVTVNGGTYVAKHTGMQGEGAIRIFANGNVTVKDTSTTGGIHVFDASSYTITGNNVSFTYDEDTPYVGILVFYTNAKDNLNGETIANDLVNGNTIAVPNTSSIYTQVVNGGWESEEIANVPAANSVAKIGNNYYNTLQDAVDVVVDNGTITLARNAGSATVSKAITFKVDATSSKYTATITAGSGYSLTKTTSGDVTTYTVTKKNDGGSSSGGSSGGGGGSSSYAVSVSSASNGSVNVSPKNASKGKTVTITVKPDAGYELDKLTVTDKNGDEISVKRESDTKYTFTMPSGKVTVKATFAKVSEQPGISFDDVSASAYYYDAVKWAVENGVTEGTSTTTFSPDASCTRAQMVTFLWRANGSPKAAGANPFTDVQAGSYYYDAVLWAVEKGITSGTSATTFAPNATVTRGQTVTFLHRANGSPAVSGNNPFTDVASDAYYAAAVQWAVAEGVTSGTSATTFAPDVACTRAQIVTFLYRDMA